MPSLSHGSDALKLHQNYLFFIIHSITSSDADTERTLVKWCCKYTNVKTSTTHTWNMEEYKMMRKRKNRERERERELEESDLVWDDKALNKRHLQSDTSYC